MGEIKKIEGIEGIEKIEGIGALAPPGRQVVLSHFHYFRLRGASANCRRTKHCCMELRRTANGLNIAARSFGEPPRHQTALSSPSKIFLNLPADVRGASKFS
jgi:hypothetical protein